MKKLGLIILTGLTFAATSCYKDPIIYPPIDDPGTEYCVPPVNNSGSGWIATPTTATITEAYIEGDYLKINVSYTGWEPRQFDLDWDGTIDNDQASVTLTDYGYTEDPNGSQYAQSQCYDLTSLRTAEHGYVTLNLAGYAGELIYKY
jgi:hypothetical protein